MIKKYGKIVAFWAAIATILGFVLPFITTLSGFGQSTDSDGPEGITIDVNGGVQDASVIAVDEGINNENGTIIIIEGNVINTTPAEDVTNPAEETKAYGTTAQTRLLHKARQYYEDGNYTAALGIYTSPELRDNDYAIINLAHFYAHGYAVDADISLAMKLYDSVDSDDARRNKLALMIFSNDGGKYDDEIADSFQYFFEAKDYYVLNYWSLCKYGKLFDLHAVKQFDYELSDFKGYEAVWTHYFTSSQSSFTHTFDKLVYNGTISGSNAMGEKGIYYRYTYYRRKHIEWIDRLYG